MDPVAATPGNFLSHIAANDNGGAADGGDDNAVPDKPVQVQDAPEPVPEKPVPLDPGDPTDEVDPEAPTEEPPPPDETAELETLRKLKQDLDGDALPETLATKTWPVKIDGQMYDVPIAELGKGYQRQSDYSRKLAELKQEKGTVDQIRAGAQRLLQDLSDPETFMPAIKELGLYKAFLENARREGRRRLELRNLPPEAQELHFKLEEERDQREAALRRAQQLERQMQEFQRSQPKPEEQRMRHQLEQMVPRAFAKHKLTDFPLARDLFASNLKNLHEGGEITSAVVDAAAQATAEQIAEIATTLPKARPANDNPLPVRRAAPAAGKPVARRQSGTSSDFAAHLERLNGSR